MPPRIGPGVVIKRSPLPTFIPAFAVQSGEGLTVETPTGDSVTVKADTRKTNGSLTVLELLIGPKEGPALHTHLREDELWYVIEGDFRFKAGDSMLRAPTARLALAPPGTRHASQPSVRSHAPRADPPPLHGAPPADSRPDLRGAGRRRGQPLYARVREPSG